MRPPLTFAEITLSVLILTIAISLIVGMMIRNKNRDTSCTSNEINTQPNTPATNPKGEVRSGKINKGFAEGHLEENTAGVEARRGSRDAILGANE